MRRLHKALPFLITSHHSGVDGFGSLSQILMTSHIKTYLKLIGHSGMYPFVSMTWFTRFLAVFYSPDYYRHPFSEVAYLAPSEVAWHFFW